MVSVNERYYEAPEEFPHAQEVLDGASDSPSPSAGLQREVRVLVVVDIERTVTDGDNICKIILILTLSSTMTGFSKYSLSFSLKR